MDQCFPGGRGSFAELSKVCAWPQLFLSVDNVTGAFAATLPGISWTLMEMRHLQLLKTKNLFPAATIWFSMRRWLLGQKIWKCKLFNPVLWRDLSSRRGEVVAELSSPQAPLGAECLSLNEPFAFGAFGVGIRDREKLTLASEQNWWIWWGC